MGRHSIKGLTILQPWCSLITHGTKRVENRSWSPRGMAVGDYLAIHAGARVDLDQWGGADDTITVKGQPPFMAAYDAALLTTTSDRALRAALATAVPYGAILGVAVLADVETRATGDDPWWVGPVGWRLADVVAFERPVPCKGAQGLWDLPADVHAVVRERWDAARKAVA